MDGHEFEIAAIEPGTPAYDQANELRFHALFEPFGLPESVTSDTDGRRYEHVAAFADARVVGYARIWLASDPPKIFQMAVDQRWRCRGVGTAVLRRLVEIAREAGATEVVLDSRVTAIGFYERLGFVAEGPVFSTGRTGLPHRVMRLRVRE